MAAHNYIPSGTFLKCDKGTVTPPLIAVNPTSIIRGKQWATTGDNIVGQSFQTFGTCSCPGKTVCTPAVTKWEKTAGSDIICIGNELLIDESILPCTFGGIISILIAPPPADAPGPPSGALSNLIKKMNGIVGTIMAPINAVKGAISGAIGGVVGGALDGVFSDMTANAIGQAVGNKIASDIQSKAIEKLRSKKNNSNPMGTIKGGFKKQVDQDEMKVIKLN